MAPLPFKFVNLSGKIVLPSMVVLLSPRTIYRKPKLYKSVVFNPLIFHIRCFFVESFAKKQ